jgi:ATP-dependent Clp protease ATP-binding subunit ClpC
VEHIIGRGDRVIPGGEVGITPRAKKVIELSVDEARRLDHHPVGMGHLLLGLIREGEGSLNRVKSR